MKRDVGLLQTPNPSKAQKTFFFSWQKKILYSGPFFLSKSSYASTRNLDRSNKTFFFRGAKKSFFEGGQLIRFGPQKSVSFSPVESVRCVVLLRCFELLKRRKPITKKSWPLRGRHQNLTRTICGKNLSTISRYDMWKNIDIIDIKRYVMPHVNDHANEQLLMFYIWYHAFHTYLR